MINFDIEEKWQRQILLRELQSIRIVQCGGRPCIRGMRIRVIDVLELQAAGLSGPAEILEELPDLTIEDIQAVALYAIRRLDHRVLAVGA